MRRVCTGTPVHYEQTARWTSEQPRLSAHCDGKLHVHARGGQQRAARTGGLHNIGIDGTFRNVFSACWATPESRNVLGISDRQFLGNSGSSDQFWPISDGFRRFLAIFGRYTQFGRDRFWAEQPAFFRMCRGILGRKSITWH